MDICKKWNNERKIVFMKKEMDAFTGMYAGIADVLTAGGGEAVSGTPAEGSNGMLIR